MQSKFTPQDLIENENAVINFALGCLTEGKNEIIFTLESGTNSFNKKEFTTTVRDFEFNEEKTYPLGEAESFSWHVEWFAYTFSDYIKEISTK